LRKIPQSSRNKCPHCGKLVGQIPERTLTVPEAAEVLGLAPKTVYKLIAQRVISSVKSGSTRGSKVGVLVSDLEAYRSRLEYRPAL
jgi:excisionase family DNA binding protein